MKKDELEKSIMEVIYEANIDHIISRLRNGENVPDQDMVSLLNDGMSVMHGKHRELSALCLEYGNKIINMQKDISRERQIWTLFMQNKGISLYEYEMFEMRILERLFKNKEVQP